MKRSRVLVVGLIVASLAFLSSPQFCGNAMAQTGGPTMTVPNLSVRPAAEDFVTPIALEFLGAGDMLVLEKNTGKVKRVVNGVVQGTVLDLAVNNASERGLLGIALHPDFPEDPGVYRFWSCRSTVAPAADPVTPG